MALTLTPADLAPFADIDEIKAEAMIDDVMAEAATVAPCILTTEDTTKIAAARAILRRAILRWHESGIASHSAQSAGPPGFPVDPSRHRWGGLWPSEREELQQICAPAGASGAVYTISLAGPERGDGYWSAPNVWTSL